MKQCIICNQLKEAEEFARNGKYFKHSCKECDSARVRAGYQLTKNYIHELKTACAVCGYNRCKSALEFHHLDESTKLFTIGSMGGKRMWSPKTKQMIDEEIAKCVVLCANCHREYHEGLITL